MARRSVDAQSMSMKRGPRPSAPAAEAVVVAATAEIVAGGAAVVAGATATSQDFPGNFDWVVRLPGRRLSHDSPSQQRRPLNGVVVRVRMGIAGRSAPAQV